MLMVKQAVTIRLIVTTTIVSHRLRRLLRQHQRQLVALQLRQHLRMTTAPRRRSETSTGIGPGLDRLIYSHVQAVRPALRAGAA